MNDLVEGDLVVVWRRLLLDLGLREGRTNLNQHCSLAC